VNTDEYIDSISHTWKHKGKRMFIVDAKYFAQLPATKANSPSNVTGNVAWRTIRNWDCFQR